MSEGVVSTKRVYFVRHGETDANVSRLVQPPTEELNEKGLLQAEWIAERSRHLDFEKIIASDYSRAMQTAQAIARANNMEFETSPLFREFLAPSQFYGIPHVSDELLAYRTAQRANMNDPSWHFADEENYHEASQRADNAWVHLESDPATDILVVTHGLFLRLLIKKILLRELLTPDIWYRTSGTMKTSNTGITVCVQEAGTWHLLTWNDHAHFAE